MTWPCASSSWRPRRIRRRRPAPPSREGAARHRLLLGGLAALLLAVALVSLTLAQSAGTLTLAEYRARLDQLLQAVNRVDSSAASDTVRGASEALAGVTGVLLPSGQVIPVQPLLTDKLTKAEAVARLTLMRDQLAAAANDDTANRLARLERVLARREFGALGQGPSVLERVWDWLRQWWPQNLNVPSDLSPAVGRSAVWVIAAVGGVLGALLLSYWLQGFLSNFVADTEARRRQAAGEEVPLTAAQARQQAHAFAQAGSYRQAVRQLYLAALLQLEERGVLRYDKGQTNREYLAQPGVAPVREHLQPVVETFDQVWYGVREPDHTTFESYEREVEELAHRGGQGEGTE